jgi:hypothetical protein
MDRDVRPRRQLVLRPIAMAKLVHSSFDTRPTTLAHIDCRLNGSLQRFGFELMEHAGHQSVTTTSTVPSILDPLSTADPPSRVRTLRMSIGHFTRPGSADLTCQQSSQQLMQCWKQMRTRISPRPRSRTRRNRRGLHRRCMDWTSAHSYVPRQGETVNLRRGRVGVRNRLSCRRSSDRCYANPNQRSRRVEPKRSFSTRISTDALWKCPVGFGPDRKFTSTFPIALAPNSM